MANEFQVRKLNDRGEGKLDTVSRKFTELLALMEADIPAGRSRSLITTKLQESFLFYLDALSTLKAYRSEDE